MSGHPCPERLLLPEALSGRLDPAEEHRVMAHLQTCPACQDAAVDIEVALISLATVQAARDEASGQTWDRPESLSPALRVVGDASAGPSQAHAVPSVPADIPRRHLVRRTVLAAAAAVVLLGAGTVAGHVILPPRDTEHYGRPIALSPPAAAADQAAQGSAAVAVDGAALVVRLNAAGLPKNGWYECIWVAGGQTRSAGSFRAPGGVVKDVELRVAQPQDSRAWELQVIGHTGTSSRVVLEGSATAPS